MIDKFEIMDDSGKLMEPKSINNNLILWFLIMGLVPLSLVSWVSYQQANTNLIQIVEKDLQQSTELSVRFIQNWFEYRLMDLTAQSESIQNAQLLERLIIGLKEGLKENDQPLSKYVKSIDWAEAVENSEVNLINLSRKYDYIYDLFLIDIDSNILYSVAQESDFGTNLNYGLHANTKFADAVNATQETGKVGFSGLERYSPSDNAIAGFITAPILNKDGEKLGVFAVQLRLDRIFDLLRSKTSTNASLMHYLVDKNGLLLSPLDEAGRSEVLSKTISLEAFNLNAAEELEPVERFQGTRKSKGNRKQVKKRRTNFFTENAHSDYLGPKGKRVFGSHGFVKLIDVEWILVTEIDRDEALVFADWLKKVMLPLLLAFTVLLFFLAVYIARRITKPIIELENISSKVAMGDIDQHAEVRSNDEIGRLAVSFNHMLQMREIHETSLEKSNQESRQALFDLAEQRYALDQHAIVVITDANGNITFVNEKFCEISGYERDELLGQNHRILNSGFHDKTFFQNMWQKISRGEVWHAEICNKAKDGHLYWLDTTIVPFMGDNGKPKSYIAIRTDITERKQSENELIEAKIEAEIAVLAKGEFLASMSHEIRTPMNGVLGMLGLLLKSELNSEQYHRATIAQNSAQSLLALINDILDFSKVEAGKLDLELIDFNLPDMLGNSAEAMALQAQDQNLELVLDITHVGQTMVMGDPGRIRQILTNLVSNAIKFTSKGEVVIRVVLQEEDEQNWRLNCTVTDTGIGIPEDKIEHLFDSFSQVDASTTRKFGGTGLGLSIVKKLSQIMGGDASASSEFGKGSCFKFDILLEKSSQSVQVVPKVDMESLTLLVVDDNATNREVLRYQLEYWGASVIEAENAKQALIICENRVQQADKSIFDIAFLDMHMADMNGDELGRVLKSDPRFSDMKLVIMTSMGRQGDAREFADIGFSAYFPKPATTKDLFDALSVVVEDGEALHQAQPLVTRHYLKTLRNEANSKERDVSWPADTHILLVEDNQINQLVAIGVLKQFGLHADVAANGKEALDTLLHPKRETPYSVILMDCEMPEMDGYEATRAIRAGEAGEVNKNIPIIAMTANVMTGIREKCMQAGMSDYMAKPIEPDKLLAKMQEWLLDSNENSSDRTVEIDVEEIQTERVIWDQDAALNRVMGDDVLLNTVINACINDLPPSLDKLQRVVDEKDYEQIRQLSHRMKGMTGNLGGLDLQQQSAFMEDAAQQEDKDQIVKLMPILKKAGQELMDRFMLYKMERTNGSSLKIASISYEELISQLQGLENRLQQSDYIDPKELELLNHANGSPSLQSLLEQLADQITQFKNSAALETLNEISELEKFTFELILETDAKEIS